MQSSLTNETPIVPVPKGVVDCKPHLDSSIAWTCPKVGYHIYWIIRYNNVYGYNGALRYDLANEAIFDINMFGFLLKH